MSEVTHDYICNYWFHKFVFDGNKMKKNTTQSAQSQNIIERQQKEAKSRPPTIHMYMIEEIAVLTYVHDRGDNSPNICT